MFLKNINVRTIPALIPIVSYWLNGSLFFTNNVRTLSAFKEASRSYETGTLLVSNSSFSVILKIVSTCIKSLNHPKVLIMPCASVKNTSICKNHGMVWVARDLQRPPSPTPFCGQGHLSLEQIAQSLSNQVLKTSTDESSKTFYNQE